MDQPSSVDILISFLGVLVFLVAVVIMLLRRK